jgi:CDP-diacylglycerol--serine O-phosphatidyltransferase
MQIKKHLSFVPNTITSLNVLSGCLAVWNAFEGNLQLAAGFIIAAAVFDFFDGFSARLLSAYSDVGKELDSLADVISFGMAPAIITFSLLKSFTGLNKGFLTLSFPEIALLSSPFLIVVFSALRLAKFNVDTRQTTSFIGLPTPANALFFASFAFIANEGSWLYGFFSQNIIVYIALIVFMSLILIGEIPLFSFKFKSLAFKNNRLRYAYLATGLLLAPFFQYWIIPIMILLYIIIGVIRKLAGVKE